MASGVRELPREGGSRDQELVRLLADAHEQLMDRDAELARLRQVLGELEHDYRALAAQFEHVQRTRAWRAVVAYRRARARWLGR